MLSRKKTRELLMQLIYQMSLLEDYSEAAREKFLAEHAAELVEEGQNMVYFNQMYSLIRDHGPELDQIIQTACENWKLGRISNVDLSILRLATAEIRYMKDIPKSVSIDVAVRLARRYGGDNSSKFVNGVLGKVPE